MKHIAPAMLLCVLSACVSSVGELRQAPADKVATFPIAVEPFSYCVHRAMEDTESPYTYRLSHRPDRQEFFILATRMSDAITMRQMAGLEVRFLVHHQTTTVEMREGAIDGGWLGRQTWPLIERCSQQGADRSVPDADAPRQSASPTAARPSAP